MTVAEFTPSGRAGPLATAAVHVELGYYPEETDIARWDVSVWDGDLWADPTPPLNDVTCNVRSVSIKRGRDRHLERFRPGSAKVVLYDPDGTWSPWRTVSAGGATYATVRPGIDLRVWVDVGGEVIERFTGIVDTIDDTFPGHDEHEVELGALDYSAVLASFDGEPMPSQGAGEFAGARLTRIVTNARYPYSYSFDPGTYALQATTLDKNALDEAGLVCDTDLGALFCRGNGWLVYQDQGTLDTDPVYAEVQATFGEVEPEICYSEITAKVDLDEVKNIVTVTPVGGSPVTESDAVSIAMYQPRTHSRTDLILANPADTSNVVHRLLTTYAYAANRIEDFEVLLSGLDAADVQTVLELGLLHRVLIRRRADGFTIDAELQLEAIGEEITPSEWKLTFHTFSADKFTDTARWNAAGAVWDSAKWGF